MWSGNSPFMPSFPQNTACKSSVNFGRGQEHHSTPKLHKVCDISESNLNELLYNIVNGQQSLRKQRFTYNISL